MNQSITRFLGRPRRQAMIGFCIFCSLTLVIAVITEAGLIAGVATLGTLSGVFAVGLHIFPARPVLDVGFRLPTAAEKHATVHSQRTVRPLDKEAIIDEQVREALASMPVPPVPKGPLGSPLGNVLKRHRQMGTVQAKALGVTQASLEDFQAKVSHYRGELEAWLGDLERVRAEKLRVFQGAIRVREMGGASADHVRVRLSFPEFQLADDLPFLDSAPNRPHYRPKPLDMSHIRTPEPFAGEVELSPSSDPDWTYAQEGETVVAECDVGRVNQEDRRDTSKVELRSAPPGKYQIEWTITADGLREPAQGRLNLDVAEPKQGEPITTFAEAEAEYERYRL